MEDPSSNQVRYTYPLVETIGRSYIAEHGIQWLTVARLLLTSRALDDLEERELAPSGRVYHQISARGHELGQILLGLWLDHPHDGVSVYYRSRPLMLALGLTIEEALAGSMARSTGLSGGRDGAVVFNMPSRGRATVLPMAGDVGGQYSPAAGWAQGTHYHRAVLRDAAYDGAIAVALGGDGSVATPGFWSTLNAATTLNLPLLFVIEDNGYAISVPSTLQVPGGNIAANLASYVGLRVLDGDGTDPLDSAEKIWQALEHVRAGHGPVLTRLRVPRLNGHSFSDNQAYKDEVQKAAEWACDPLQRLRTFMLENDWTGQQWDELTVEVECDVRAALEHVADTPEPDPRSATRFVFFDPQYPQQVGGSVSDTITKEQNNQMTLHRPDSPLTPPSPHLITLAEPEPRINLVDSIRLTLDHELSINPQMVVFGEDVGYKGGVHGATRNLQIHFGSERVFDTGLTEEGIVGRAVGMALNGLLPVPEIQFRKYADPAMEQIVNCGSIRWRTNNKFAAPLVLRIPIGYSKMTGDPWHSVSGEAIFAHTIGWQMAIPSNAIDAVGLLRTALRGNDPVFFLEHRALLDTPMSRRPYPGDKYVLPFGQAAVRQAGDMLTIVTWGAMVYRCLEAAVGLANIEIIDLRTIVPWDCETVLESVRKTGRCLVVHEDTWTAGFGAEVAATVAQEAFTWLDAPVQRVATPDCPVPYNAQLFAAVIPTTSRIRSQIEALLQF